MCFKTRHVRTRNSTVYETILIYLFIYFYLNLSNQVTFFNRLDVNYDRIPTIEIPARSFRPSLFFLAARRILIIYKRFAYNTIKFFIFYIKKSQLIPILFIKKYFCNLNSLLQCLSLLFCQSFEN